MGSLLFPRRVRQTVGSCLNLKYEGASALDTYKIIEQVLLLRTLLLSCYDPCETVFSHVLQVICIAGNQHHEPCKPWEVSNERKNPAKIFRTRRHGNKEEK